MRQTTQQRINQLMSERNLKQVDILNMSLPLQKETGIKMSKSHLSQYVNGKSSPDQHKLYLLSKTLQVNEAWLLGYDVPKNDNSEHNTSPPTQLIPLDEKLGAKITELAKEKDISDDAMAKFIGIGMDDIEEYKAGKKPFSVNMVFNFAMALGVTFDDLFPEDIEYDKIPAITKVDNEHNCIMTADGSKYQLTDDEMQRVNNLLLFKNRQ
ncbi:hypothetical protein IGI96_000946 [Enterococcus sp. DIV0421]|uniref:helix-turn-helix domain-containing protein n=1 Tax=Enterococcus sp. DIV0421 TaxID=2774688 RepID=UPI003F290EC2